MVKKELTVGIKGTAETIVTDSNTARAMGSGNLDVFATPSMVALMERAASESVLDALDEGQTTVGTVMNIAHISASPVGIKVRAESELVEIDKRHLVFRVKAFDEKEQIGEGTHERFIVLSDRFIDKTNSKKD